MAEKAGEQDAFLLYLSISPLDQCSHPSLLPTITNLMSRRFSVEFLVSMSTNFVGSAGENSKVSLFVTGMRKLRLSDNSVDTQRFADGGTSDLMGIIPLVDQGTKNIISVYNFNQNPDFTGFTNSYADIYNAAPCTSMEDPDFDIHFQTWLKHINPRITCYQYLSNQSCKYHESHFP